MSFAIKMDTSGYIQFFEGFSRRHGHEYPSFTPYKSRAKTWKQAHAANRFMAALARDWEDYIFIDYEHVDLDVAQMKAGDPVES